jgi:signal transduction histidine kinase
VADNLTEIAEGGEIDFEKKIPVTSNDEIGDLVVSFNKIQEREIQNIKATEQQQKILTERERLASLGQMIGGIAHNLNSPIMSIAGGIEALKDLVTEYKESVDDINVNKEDHLEIAQEMETWLNDMKPYCAYMSDVLSTVKGQAVQLNASLSSSFTLDELLKRIEILTKFELHKYDCTLNCDCMVDTNIEIRGEISNLVQVFNNLISNAIQSYEGKGGIIKLEIALKDAHVEFAVRDYGVGIPEDIQQKLFKEMVTTKGTMGNGLGLYMSYATIKGRFGGDLWFESEYGKGTTFYISIPTYKN